VTQSKLGVWLIGALGNDATLAVVGTEAMRAGLAERTGLVTDLVDFRGIGLAELDELVFGGHDIREGDFLRSAEEFMRDNGVLTPDLLAKLAPRLRAAGREIRLGTAAGCGEAIHRMAAPGACRDGVPLRAQIRDLQRDFAAFRKRNGLARLVVVNLASTEPAIDLLPEFQTLGAFERLLDSKTTCPIPASILYAYAAIDAGCPHINFAPSLGCSLPALDELARIRGVPRMGKDGKTGETLMKTVLAPMFQARNLRILSWEGHNLLGNRDGQILDHPQNNLAKVRDKDIVRKLLGEQAHSRVRVDYCPSLADWKTAWDFIHFEGFLGAKMRLHFIWEGCDTALASPLVLDLVRLADLAHRRGEGGSMPHAACFFKTPYGVDEIAFPAQFDRLRAYARRVREDRKGAMTKVKSRAGKTEPAPKRGP
jgi:myo-inositol-1-phosphate synthase